MDGQRRDTVPAPPAGEELDLLIPPRDLLPPQRAYWRRWARLAIEQRTLTEKTVPGFREVCWWAAEVDGRLAVRALVERKHGKGSREAREAFSDLLKARKELRTALSLFKLTAFGKPEHAAPARKPAANPWSQVASS
jgi:hypothetical protein